MNSSEGYLKSDYPPPAFLGGMNLMKSSEGYYSPDMKMKRDNPIYPWDLGSGSGYSKRQKKKQEEEEEEDDNTPQVEYCFPGQDTHSRRRDGGGRRGGGRYSLREFCDPRLGHAQFLKDKSLNPFITLPPKYQRPDFVQNPDNPVVGFRFIGTGPPIPITAVDIARETAKHEYTRLSPYGGTEEPPLRFSEADLLKRSIQQSEEEAKKLDEMVRNEAEELRKGDLRLAQEAIKFYNATNGTCYEVVATLGSYHHLDRGHWYHCNFRARDTKGRSSQPKLFFSELFCPGADMIGAKVCKMLDGPGQRPHTVLGCKICGDLLLHPVNGFECGK